MVVSIHLSCLIFSPNSLTTVSKISKEADSQASIKIFLFSFSSFKIKRLSFLSVSLKTECHLLPLLQLSFELEILANSLITNIRINGTVFIQKTHNHFFCHMIWRN